MRSMLVIGLLCALQTPTAAAQCRSPEYRQFDFWMGDWDAYDLPDTAKAVARIQVSSIMDGCALREVYVQKERSERRELQPVGRVARRWHQSWVTEPWSPAPARGTPRRRADGADRAGMEAGRELDAAPRDVVAGRRERAAQG